MGPPVMQNKLRNPRKQNVPLRMNPSSSYANTNNSTYSNSSAYNNNYSGAPSPNTSMSWNLNGMKQK